MKKNVVELEKAKFKRVLNVWDLFAIGYGDLGSSIYYALGITALFALGATPIALALAGVVFICTALTYAEMTSTFHESGGSASYARHAFNDLISFIAGWGLLLDYIVTIAISAFAVGPYLAYFFPDLKLVSVQIGFTIGIIFILLLLNIFGVRQSAKVSLALSGFTILTQVIIIIIGGVWLFNLPYILEHLQINVKGASWSPSWPEFWKGTAMAMVAYTGIESIAQLGAEAKTPAKTVPRAIVITMLFLIVLYIGISTVALSSMSPQILGTKYIQDPLAGIVVSLPFGGEILRPWIGIIGAAILIVAANAGLVGASRLSYNMGEYYQLPRFFYKLMPRFRTPGAALGFFALLASLVVLWSRGKLSFLADLYNFGAMIAFFFAHLSLITLRIKQPHIKRPFRAPLNVTMWGYSIPLTALFGCLATASVWVLIVITKPEGRYLGFAWMVLGVGMYFFYRHKKKLLPMGQLEIERIKVPEFKPLEMHKILVITKEGANSEALQVACEMAKTHKSHVDSIHIIEVPFSMPLDAILKMRTEKAHLIMKKEEAISRELNIKTTFEILRARSFLKATLSLAKDGHYDLLIIGLDKNTKEESKQTLSASIQRIIQDVPCRVWVCSSKVVKKL